MMAGSPVIETSGLSKVFGEKVAVRSLTLTVERGEVFGFLGPNGAGKTTSVNMLLGLIKPSAGEGRILGAPLGDFRGRARVGFLPEHFRFHEWLTAREFLQVHANLYQVPNDLSRRRIAELLDLVGLAEHAGKKLQAFSKGMLQRIGLAQAMLNEPELVILDEPTSGLDPVGRRLVRDIIRSLKEQGATVFLNSHLLSEVEVTCDRVAFIKHGEVIQVSELETLMQGSMGLELRLGSIPASIMEGLRHWTQDIHVRERGLHLQGLKESDVPEINRYLVGEGVDVLSFHLQEPSLEDMFIQIVGLDGGL
jgi:ABC-2 type transport system ATP-binding protein